MRRKRCRNDKHTWRPLKGGKFEKCTSCGDVFPCRKTCPHLDCAWVKGVPPDPESLAIAGALHLDFSKEGLRRWK